MHAIIEVMGADVSIIDLGSTRGTFVNGTKINKTKLQSGDVILVGDTTIEIAIAQAAPVLVAVPPPVPMPVAPAPMPVATQTLPPPAPMAMAPAPVAPPVYITEAADDPNGARAVEVATMLGDTVVGVKHCMDPKSGKVTPRTWGFVAAGLACLLTSATAFAISVNEAARNKGALDYWTHVQKRPAHAFRPVTSGPGLDYLAFGGLAFGLLGVTAGLARARRERKSPFYRIGTAPGVEQALESAPSADFPMVAPASSGESEFVFNFGAGMDGEMTVNGQTTPLAELAQTGRARPSATTPGATEVPIPAAARIRVRSGMTTFLVSAVARPREAAVPMFPAFEGRAAKYFAGSLAVHLGLVAFLATIPEADGGVNIELGNVEATSMKGDTKTQEDVPPPPDEDLTSGDSGGKDGAGAKMALDEGAAGNPNSQRADGHMQIKDNQKEPALSRDQAIEQARNSGFLGDTARLTDSIHALAATQDWSSGFDGTNVYGPLFGADGEGKGSFGGGVRGWGPGGGCGMPPCGIIGTGRYGTIGNGEKAGDGWGTPGPGHGGMRNHNAVPVEGIIGRPILDGDLDKAIIKRYIKRSVDRIAYCYEKQLLAKPNLEGTVNVSFYIDPNGNVKSANGSGVDGAVSSCVAEVISNISFPKPKNGGGVQVNYPFNFPRPAQCPARDLSPRAAPPIPVVRAARSVSGLHRMRDHW